MVVPVSRLQSGGYMYRSCILSFILSYLRVLILSAQLVNITLCCSRTISTPRDLRPKRL